MLNREFSRKFLLLTFYGTSIVGFYAIAEKVLKLPTEIVKGSLRQVLFPKIVERYHSGKNMMSFAIAVLTGMAVLYAIPCLCVALFGKQLFSFILGPDWAYAGTYARWLVIWIFFAFLTGVGISFTPCVWPIYPITSSVIINSSSVKTKNMALILSLTYVLGLAVTYSILGAVTGHIGLFQIP